MKTFIKIFVKLLFALGILAAGLAAFRIWSDSHGDYIEIYNNDDDLEGDFYV